MRLVQLSRFLAVTVLAACAIPALAQAAQPAQPGQPGQGGGRGNFDPAAFQQRMLDRYKQALGASDEEWQALSPKVAKVLEVQRSTRGGGGFGGRQRGGNGGNNAPTANPATPTTPVAAAAKDLQAAIDNKDTKPEELKAKLTALRDARAKAKEELVAAQKDLQGLLTQRQEATLVQMGLLD